MGGALSNISILSLFSLLVFYIYKLLVFLFLIYLFIYFFYTLSKKTDFGHLDPRPPTLSQVYLPRSDTLLVSFHVALVVVVYYLERGLWSVAAFKWL